MCSDVALCTLSSTRQSASMLTYSQSLTAAGILLIHLATIEGTLTEGILHMTQADYDAFNIAGGDLLATWDGEAGHHVEFVLPGDFDDDGDVDGADFLVWQHDQSIGSLTDWQSYYGTVAPLSSSQTGVPEPATLAFVALGELGMG
jgi:hypothetical protein